MAATALMDDVDITNEQDVVPRDDELFEVVDGERIGKPLMSAYAGKLGSRLIRRLGDFADDKKLGETVGEVLFRLPLREDAYRNRRPDVAFVSFSRWPLERSMPVRDNVWDVVPDLAVEVISPHNPAEESVQKVREYFEAGVILVWVVYPEERQIYVYESPKQIRVLTSEDTLDGGTVLAGFRLPLIRLFDPILPPGDGT
jgi:Uma2 family endonuclease